MFIKLTLQDSGEVVFVNFSFVENFYRLSGWTSVLMQNGRVYDCSETPERLLMELERDR